MTTAIIIHTLINRGNFDELRGNHQTLRSAGLYLELDDYYVLGYLLKYAERFGKYPTYVELEAFITHSKYLHELGPERRDAAARRCLELSEAGLPVLEGSMAQLLEDFTVTGRAAMYASAFKLAHRGLTAKGEIPGTEKCPSLTEADRIPAVLKYLDKVRSGDFTLPPSAPEGAWRENAELGADALIDGLKDSIRDRSYTGFRHIDEAVAIGPGQPIKFVGILAFTNHCKSTVMRSMAYNMARSGKRILFIAREDSALNTWTQLSFLHSYARPDIAIPDINVWRNQPQKITPEQQDNLRLLVDDLQYGQSVPGEIVVTTHATWSQIAQELEVGLNGKHFDVLMIDYLAHLDTGMSGPKMHDEYKRLFKAAQKLAIDYKGGRGLVVVTPLQSNKTGMAAADQAEGNDWGIYTDLGAVEQYTDAARDMDLVIGVWHKDLLKTHGMIKVSCMKSRENFFQPHFLTIDRRTRMVMDLPGGPKSDMDRITTYRDMAEEAALTPEEIRIQTGG
jgi:hypothetical protein